MVKGYLYLAAPWIERDYMGKRAQIFEEAGYEITHKWWDFENNAIQTGKEFLQRQAELDRDGVCNADALVLFNTGKSEGKAVEQGIALGCDMPIVAIGRLGEFSQNVFHYLPNYHWVSTEAEAVTVLKELGFE